MSKKTKSKKPATKNTDADGFEHDFGLYAVRQLAQQDVREGKEIDPALKALLGDSSVENPGPDDDPPYGFELMRNPDVAFVIEAAAKKYGLAVVDVLFAQATGISVDDILRAALNPEGQFLPELVQAAYEAHLQDAAIASEVQRIRNVLSAEAAIRELLRDKDAPAQDEVVRIAREVGSSEAATRILDNLVKQCPKETDSISITDLSPNEGREARRQIHGSKGKPGPLLNHELVGLTAAGKAFPTQRGRTVRDLLKGVSHGSSNKQ